MHKNKTNITSIINKLTIVTSITNKQGVMEMNKEVKDLIVDAFAKPIKDGGFRQAGYELRVVDKRTKKVAYCALGVVTELYRQHTGKGEWVLDVEYPNTAAYRFRVNGTTYGSGLSPEVSAWAGFATTGPVFHLKKVIQKDATNLAGKPFSRTLKETAKKIFTKHNTLYPWHGHASLMFLNDTEKVRFATLSKFFNEVPDERAEEFSAIQYVSK